MLQSWHFFEAFPSIVEEGGDKLGAFGAAIASVVIVWFCDLSSLMSVTLTSSRKVLSSPINKKKKRDDKAKSQFFTPHTNIGSLITFKWSKKETRIFVSWSAVKRLLLSDKIGPKTDQNFVKDLQIRFSYETCMTGAGQDDYSFIPSIILIYSGLHNSPPFADFST